MLGEKEDWAARKIAPFAWVNQEITSDSTGRDLSCGQPEIKSKLDTNKVTNLETDNHLESKGENMMSMASAQQLARQPAEDLGSLPQSGLSSSNSSFTSNQSLHNLKTHYCLMTQMRPPTLVHISEDGNSKRIGRKARIMDLGKKMGEKLEEKRRHIEEKSRNIVEKMSGP
ncbi:hypothetical protein AQUCO_06000032v1 [Aquilegia coerulea]|uniref:Uncharacterized protein n=1 Tax=Aquilegia coerulea TaxID=218851 RepID=A0A2G5CDM1_AQUCA|nr:hypothetical protein AQUCO_06000032v1 [Aquilegia coerulea]